MATKKSIREHAGDNKMNLVTLVVMGLVGGGGSSLIVTNDSLDEAITAHLNEGAHPAAEALFVTQGKQIDILLEESLRKQISDYTDKLCMDPNNPQAQTWVSERDRLLGLYFDHTDRPYPAGLLECR